MSRSLMLLLSLVLTCCPVATPLIFAGDAASPDHQDQPISRRIVFIIDGAGLSKEGLALVSDEIAKAVVGLKPIQYFNIIIVQADGMFVMSDRGPVAATPTNKKLAAPFFNQLKASDKGDVIPAISRAFKDKPQLIYLLAHQSFTDNDAVVKKIHELNPQDPAVAHNVSDLLKINTIAFDPDDRETAIVDMLKRIANDNSGTFVKVKSGPDSTTQPAKGG